MTLAQLMADTRRRLTDHYSGRIESYGGCWEYADTIPAEVAQGFSEGKTSLAIGEGKTREIWRKRTDGVTVCRAARGVQCPNTAMYPNAYASDEGVCWVRQSACKKCEHYRSAAQSPEKNPVCQWARDKRLGDRTVSQAVSQHIMDSLEASGGW